MSEVINSIFGRSQNDTSRHGGFVPTSTAYTAEPDVTPESVDTTGIVVDETVEPAGEAAVNVARETDLVAGIADEGETTGTLTDDTAEADTADTDDTTEANTADTDDTTEANTADTDDTTDGAATDDSAELADEGSELAEEPESDDHSGDLAESAVSIGDASEQGSENIGDAAEVAQEAEITDEDEPADEAVTTDDETVAEALETDEVEQAEPVAEARTAAAMRGDTTVEDGVIAKVVDMLVRKVEGVRSLEDTNISVDGDVVTIKVSVVLEFGHAVKAVAGQIRTSVIDAVEELLGLDVAAVDVRITDVYLSDAS